MKRHVLQILKGLLILLCGFFCSCGQVTHNQSTCHQGDTISLKYARHLTMIENDSFTVVQLQNPWDTTQVLHTYILYDKKKPQPKNLPQGTVVPVPLSHVLLYSSVHGSLWEQLGALDGIAGVCDASFIMSPAIRERLRSGQIGDFGQSTQPNLEKIVNEQVDALFPSPFENSGSYGKLSTLNIPIIECADYMETSALGRAEWMRFYGRLIGKAAEADSLFQQVEQRYLHLKKMVANKKKKPHLLCEMKTGNSWFMPTGNSTTGRLYQDAGAHYLFDHLSGSGAQPLSFETVLQQAENADVWLIKYHQQKDMTYKQLQSDYSPYSYFSPWRKKKIYGCNTRYVRYYEETSFQPQLLLEDLIRILHPDVLPKQPNRYFTPLS